jgi:2-polyprenyl-6-methoxyphenol hydroxylase-like FAD-dependent oxidoreductase
VTIIGAGPGGLSAALALSKLGIAVGVFERAREFRPIGAALLGMNIAAYESLKAIGGETLALKVHS